MLLTFLSVTFINTVRLYMQLKRFLSNWNFARLRHFQENRIGEKTVIQVHTVSSLIQCHAQNVHPVTRLQTGCVSNVTLFCTTSASDDTKKAGQGFLIPSSQRWLTVSYQFFILLTVVVLGHLFLFLFFICFSSKCFNPLEDRVWNQTRTKSRC